MELSFIIPAHNEEETIASAIEAVSDAAAKTGLPFEILVVDDSSTDRTAEIARTKGARVIRANVRQIARARNAGAAAAVGNVFVFVDADTLVNPAVVRSAINAIGDGAVGGGAGVRLDEPVPVYVRLFVPPFVWLLRQLRFAAGCFFFCTRDAFRSAGGFDESLFVAEEIALSRALHRLGRFVILRERVLTSGRKVRTYSGWEIFKSCWEITWGGRRAIRDRSRLKLWYGPRRQDGSRK